MTINKICYVSVFSHGFAVSLNLHLYVKNTKNILLYCRHFYLIVLQMFYWKIYANAKWYPLHTTVRLSSPFDKRETIAPNVGLDGWRIQQNLLPVYPYGYSIRIINLKVKSTISNKCFYIHIGINLTFAELLKVINR